MSYDQFVFVCELNCIMLTVLITGSNRGIGLELIRQFLKHSQKPDILIATCRNPDQAKELQKLVETNKNLKIVKLDVTNTDSYAQFVKEVDAIVGSNGLNVLINNAAIKPETTDFHKITVENYKQVLETNTVAPLFLSRAILPLLKKASKANTIKPISIHRSAIINITSLLGSVSLSGTYPDTYYAYGESKAALNYASRSMTKTLAGDKILVSVLHPGWVKTDLGGPQAPLTVEESGGQLIKVIYELNEQKNGKYLDYSGSEIAW